MERTIRVTGKGKLSLKPDTIRLRIELTDLEKEYAAGAFRCLTMEEYGTWLKGCIDLLPKDVVVHRITGDGAKKDLIAPLWSADKKRVLNYLHKVLNI